MRSAARWRCPGALFGQVLPSRHALHSVRRRGRIPVSVGGHPARPEDVRLLGDAGVHPDCAGRALLCVEEGRTGLGIDRRSAGESRMTLAPPITDIEQLKAHPAVARLLGWNTAAVQAVKFDRDELTIWVEKSFVRDACAILRDDASCPFNYLCDLTCVDWYPAEPRFEVVYHLLSIPQKERVRLKARVDGSTPVIE